MSTRVIFSTDANPNYAFYAPLTALMWEECGYRSTVLVVGACDAWWLDRLNEVATIHRLPNVRGVSTAAMTQFSRLYGYLVCDPSDWVLMGDVDAWPLSARPFSPVEGALLMYASSCIRGQPNDAYPMGYIGMQASDWRAVMSSPSESIEGAVALVRAGLSGEDPLYNRDEAFVTARLKAWDGYPLKCTFVPRDGDPIRGRIDRSAWPAIPHVDGMIDAHLIRPGFTDENWPRIRPLLEQRLTTAAMRWADDYRAEWVAK